MRRSSTAPAVFLSAIVLSAVPGLGESTAAARYGYCADGVKAGWNFYCDPEKEDAQEQEPKPPAPVAATAPAAPEPPQSYTEKIELYRKQMDELKFKAVLEPTPENVTAYMEAQQQMSRMATAFTDTWQRVLFKTPSLDINSRFPMSQMGGAVYQDQMRVARENSLKEAAANLGFMVIVEDAATCGLCTPQLEIISRMQKSYGIEPIIVTVDGSFHPLFPNAVVDTGQLRSLGLEDSPRPTIALVEPRSGVVEPIGSGLLTEDVILERVHVVTQVPNGERY